MTFQDAPTDTAVNRNEGSGDDGYGDHPLYRHDDEEDEESSGEGVDSDWSMPEDIVDDIVNIDDEIDPRDLDIDFHEEVTTAYSDITTPETISLKTSVPAMNPLNPSDSISEPEDPHKHLTPTQDPNFFAQPGIVTGEDHS